jgi:hypothetical protein
MVAMGGIVGMGAAYPRYVEKAAPSEGMSLTLRIRSLSAQIGVEADGKYYKSSINVDATRIKFIMSRANASAKSIQEWKLPSGSHSCRVSI